MQTIAPERPARGGGYQACLSPASPHAPDREGITRGGAGEGTPSPSKRTTPALPQGPRAGSGDIVVRSLEGRKPGKANADTLSSPPPRPRFALLPRPGAGAVQVIAPERRVWSVGSDYILRRCHPTHRTVGVPSPSTKTIPALPQGPRAGAGALVVMAREGRPRGSDPKHYFPQASTHAPLSSLPHPCGRGQCR